MMLGSGDNACIKAAVHFLTLLIVLSFQYALVRQQETTGKYLCL